MPYVKKFRISEEGNHYPEGDETFVSDEVFEDLEKIKFENEYYQSYELPYNQRIFIPGNIETVDFNRQF